MEKILALSEENVFRLVDITGGSPELHPALTRFISALWDRGLAVQVRTNLTALMEPSALKLIPFLRERVIGSYDRIFKDLKDDVRQRLTKPHVEYFRMFYNDTAINGNTSALMCAYEFCGAEHLLFATDNPFDTELGERKLRQVIKAIEQMAISAAEKEKIFEGNAKRLLALSA